MTRDDMIAREVENAALYEREAKRRTKNPALVEELRAWAKASRIRAERLRAGPLFGGAA